MNLTKPITSSRLPVKHSFSAIRGMMTRQLVAAFCHNHLGHVLLGVLVLAVPSFAQFTSNVRGVVTDGTGAVLPNATVLLENLSTGAKQTVTTDGSGNYRFNSVAPGRYKISAQAAGFGTRTVETALTTEQTAAVDLQLSTAAVTEQVNVTSAVGPLLNPDETRLQVTVAKAQVDELPLQNRNIYSIVTIAPGVTGFVDAGSSDNFVNENRVQASANGHFSGQNEYLLDGFSISSAITGGTANIAPNPDSVQEAALQTNNFSVEQGQGSSIQVEMTTRSGTNALHGAVNYLYTDNNLKAFGYFQKVYNPFRRHDVSASVGGPIIKDRLFFFGSTEVKRRLGTSEHRFCDSGDACFCRIRSKHQSKRRRRVIAVAFSRCVSQYQNRADRRSDPRMHEWQHYKDPDSHSGSLLVRILRA